MNPLQRTPILVVIIPCYNAERHIGQVIAEMPPMIERIYCVDDASTDGTALLLEQLRNTNRKIRQVSLPQNQGVGGAMIAGYRAAITDASQNHELDRLILIKMDSDHQMDPHNIPQLIAPIVSGAADYAKGNRFFYIEDVQSMPRMRVFGNICLSFLNKLSSGYYSIFDPTNGYTAIQGTIAAKINWDKIHRRYFFESDLLFRLNLLRAVVVDVPMAAHYGDETSHLSIHKQVGPFILGLLRNLGKRIFYNYFWRDVTPVTLYLVAGGCLVVFALYVGLKFWVMSSFFGQVATAGKVMLAALPMIIGCQFLFSAWQLEMANEPRLPLHPRIRE
ncbi:MAG: glycosyltransferase family 2 protein [Alphaproteobacteria bacterium]|nr:glycosyltransferase family 2 protein [Alphaproteobacteria bacterium]